ncbi:MAG: hypothetical protein AB7U75_13540 [Hyphomicrobiaceae bacterium]
MRRELIGIGAGAAFGLLNLFVLRVIALRIEGTTPTPEKKRTAGLLRKVALVDVFVFAILGYFVASMLKN